MEKLQLLDEISNLSRDLEILKNLSDGSRKEKDALIEKYKDQLQREQTNIQKLSQEIEVLKVHHEKQIKSLSNKIQIKDSGDNLKIQKMKELESHLRNAKNTIHNLENKVNAIPHLQKEEAEKNAMIDDLRNQCNSF